MKKQNSSVKIQDCRSGFSCRIRVLFSVGFGFFTRVGSVFSFFWSDPNIFSHIWIRNPELLPLFVLQGVMRKLPTPLSSFMLLISEGNSEHLARASRKIGLFRVKKIKFVTLYDLIKYLYEIK